MTRTKQLAVVFAILIASLAAMDAPVAGLRLPGLVSPAEARVGRPLTPVSVAGVGRRTVRRCAVGVYDC